MKTSFPKSKIRVALLESIHPRAHEMFTEEGVAIEVNPQAMQGATLAHLVTGSARKPAPGRTVVAGEGGAAAGTGVHVLGIRSKTRVDAALIENAPRLLAIGCFCIGTDQVDLHAASLRGVPVFNSPFSNTRSVAELTIG